MIKIEHMQAYNVEGAIRGMRNPMESHNLSDSKTIIIGHNKYEEPIFGWELGYNDMQLALKLIKAGTDHSKFMRQITVSMDISAPLYWWKEMDTYKVSTVANSESTMHKLTSKPLTSDDFEDDDKDDFWFPGMLEYLNDLIKEYNKTRLKHTWRLLIQRLPSSFIQKRTWTGNYQNLRNIYHNRKNHRLDEWQDFREAIEKLPYSQLITS